MLSERQKALYRRTIEVALSSPSRKQVGAILLKKNNIIAQATNLEKKDTSDPSTVGKTCWVA